MEKVIREFDPVLYPSRLWVGIDTPFEQVIGKFSFFDTEGCLAEDDDAKREYESHYNAYASTFHVADRESGWKGCLVVIWRRKDCGVGVCAHEASHYTDFIDESFGIGGHTFNDGEARAYLIQWAANCIYEVLRGK